MAKRTQVVLSKDVTKLGKNGDLVDVAPGYARNYLIPQGLAIPATPGVIKMVEQRREKERQRQLEILEHARARKTALATIGLLRIAKQAGEGDAIFGTVTNQDIADLLKEKAGQEVDKRDITLPDINHLGEYQVELKLHPEVSATVNIEVIAQ